MCTAEGAPADLMQRVSAHSSGKTLYRRYIDEQRLQQEATAATTLALDAKDTAAEAAEPEPKPDTTTSEAEPDTGTSEEEEDPAPVFASREEARAAALEEIAALRAMGLGSEVEELLAIIESDVAATQVAPSE
jgi:hypothetical protein